MKKDLASVFQFLPGLYLILKPDAPRFTIEAVSDAYVMATHTKRDKIIKKGLFEVFPDNPQDPEANGVANLSASLNNVLKNKKTQKMPVQKYDIPHPDGGFEERFWSPSNSPVINDDGKVTHIIHSVVDVSEQVRVQTQLNESEERFRNLADTAPMYLAMADETGNAVYFNKPWLNFTGKTLDEMLGLGWLNTLHPEDAPKFERDFKHAFSKRIPINKQYRFQRADGDYRWMMAAGAPRFAPDGKFVGYYGTYTDFHDLKVAQQAVQESETQLLTLANNISQLVWTLDKTGKPLWFNHRWQDYTGTEATSSTNFQWSGLVPVKDLKRVTKKFEQSLQHNDIWEDTFQIKGKNGRYRWFLSRALPIRDTEGQIVQWFGTSTDIDDLRRASERRVELEHTTKALKKQKDQLLILNQAKDEFISLASHQLRTPATGVKQFIGMLLEGYVGDIEESQKRMLQAAYDSNERQLKVVNDLLKVAKVDSGKMLLQKESLPIVPMIRDIVNEQASKFKMSKQNVEFMFDTPDLTVVADHTLLRMAIENLVDNASKYTPDGKDICVSATKGVNTVDIAIQDQGTGISKTDMDKLFLKFSRIDNPLSTTAGGTGLGLYWVKRVVDLHEGTIDVQSTVGEGTTFTISLPALFDE